MAELDKLLVRIEADTMQLRRELARAQAITALRDAVTAGDAETARAAAEHASAALGRLRTIQGN